MFYPDEGGARCKYSGCGIPVPGSTSDLRLPAEPDVAKLRDSTLLVYLLYICYIKHFHNGEVLG